MNSPQLLCSWCGSSQGLLLSCQRARSAYKGLEKRREEAAFLVVTGGAHYEGAVPR